MSSDRLSGSDQNRSEDAIVFPAGRRNVEWYNSRILSDDNFRRSFQASIPAAVPNVKSGTLILDYNLTEAGKFSSLQLLIEGYYIYLKYHLAADSPTLKFLNQQITNKGDGWVYIYQDYVKGPDNKVRNFLELDCKDESNLFYGIFHSTTEPADPALKIPVIVGGQIYPELDPKQDFYKPWFRSPAEWAAGKWSNKNKIWIDDIYDVPHVCVEVAPNDKRWLPLGAVYKTSNTMSENNLLPDGR